MRRPIGLVVFTILVVSLSCKGPKPVSTGGAPTSTPGASPLEPVEKPGLTMRLSEGSATAEPAETAPLAPATPLSDEESQKILSRLAPLAKAPGDERDFALRDKSLPPPRAGKTLKETFPSPTPGPAAPPKEAGPLTVLRRAPEGKVPLAPHLSVTFSQPMVPVTSVDELAKLPRPVRITPEPPGKWRWIGSKTLLFE
ncbi:MAG: hypothetical protein HY698_14245, partial [Deltaproteobacteria bacterium]|nr:hypothetical protein [Deltaproteobacteria bacterium]